MNRPACCVAAAMYLTFGLACSEDSVDSEELCNTFCTKADTCGFLVVGDIASCVAQCVSGQTSNGQTCEPSASEARACIAAYEAQSCEDLQNGVEPAACAGICPDNSDGGVSGNDGGINGDAMINTDGGINYGPNCGQLNACCQGLSGQAQLGCQAVADLNNESTCAATISGIPQCLGVDAGPPVDMGPADMGSPADTGPPADMGSPADTGPPADMGSPADTGPPADMGSPADTGPGDQGTPIDGGAGGDAGSSGMACADLNMCCPTLMNAQLMQACTAVASMMNESNCQMALDAFRQNGLCL